MKRKVLRSPGGWFFALLLATTVGPAPSYAQQDYPNRPIRLIVPYPPGGPSDLIGRLTSEILTRRLSQTVVVDNRGGASTLIGAELAARSPADGYTLLVSSELTYALNAALRSKLPYHPERDFAPISLLTTQPYVLAVSLSVPAASVSQLVAHAKSNPGKLGFASAGAGSANHLAGEMFKHIAGIDIFHVPYKGNGPATIDVIGGQVQMMMGSIGPLYPHAQTGKLKLLAVASAKRASAAPEVPTFTESGMKLLASGWNGLTVPRGTPQHVIQRLNAETVAGYSQPDVVDRLRRQSIDAIPGTPAQFAAHMRSEIARYQSLVKAVGLTPE